MHRRHRSERLATQEGHHGHFLARTLRLSDLELDHAMRLYHHSVVVRGVLSQQGIASSDERVAIAICERAPTGHVLVTGSGAFVTCLSAGMGLSGARVIPYRLFVAAMDQEDSQRADAATERDQLARLPAKDLLESLCLGPGGITREMAAIVDRRPLTYAVPVSLAFAELLKYALRLQERRGRHIDAHWRGGGTDPRRWNTLMTASESLAAAMRTCLCLMSAQEAPPITLFLYEQARLQGDLPRVIVTSLARHREGGDRLLALLYDPGFRADMRMLTLLALSMHGSYYPENLPAIGERLKQAEPPGLDEGSMKLISLLQGCAGQTPSQIEQFRTSDLITAFFANVPLPMGENWILSIEQHLRLAHEQARLPAFFPPAEQAALVQADWERRQKTHQHAMPEKPTVEQVVRGAARIGRNDPCPCQSGRKYKLCCLSGKAATAVAGSP